MTVHHRLGEYSIEFTSLPTVFDALPSNSFIVTDTHVAQFLPLANYPSHVIKPGEGSKSFETYREVISAMAKSGCNRKSVLVAIGGGVVGDLGGFCAATYMRGIPFIQVPTSLLSLVDSSVGGKVGIDLPEGKNLLGAFHAPSQVFVCADTLRTLPERQFTNGMAEVWKAGFILDQELDVQLRRERLSAGSPHLERVIRRCIEIKKEVVEADEFERLGIRAKLNFGHTVGHAIEQVQRYEGFLHGEAISIGMVIEAYLGELTKLSEPGTFELVKAGLTSQGLPVSWTVGNLADDLIVAMRRDKKATSGKLAFSLLPRIGECTLVEDVPVSAVRQALSDYEAGTPHR
jgi:3-dehydroquinate synthase